MIKLGCDAIWQVDDVTACAKHLYLQLIPYSVLLLLSISWVVVNLCKRRNEADDEIGLSPESRTPLLANTANYGAIPSSSSSSLDENNVLLKTPNYNHYKAPHKSQVWIVHRTTWERIRVGLETVFLVGQTALSLIACLTADISNEWSNSYPQTPRVLVAFWTYLLALCLIRQKWHHPQLSLWSQGALLYFWALMVSLPTLRSTLIHPAPTRVAQNFYLAQCLLTFLLFVNISSARFSDRPARIYVSNPDLTPSPEPTISLFQFCTYSWLDNLIWKGSSTALSMRDIWDLREDDHAFFQLGEFQHRNPKVNITKRLLRHFRNPLLMAVFWATVYSFIHFLPTVFLKKILEYVDNPTHTPRSVAWLYVIGMLAMAVVYNVCFAQALYIGRRMCVRLRAIIIGEVYAKALRRKVSPSIGGGGVGVGGGVGGDDTDKEKGTNQANIGGIINLMAVDAFKVAEVCSYLHYFVDAIFTLTLAIAFLYKIMGFSALAGVAIMVLLFPINYWLSVKFARMQREVMALTDQRIEKTNEVLQAIRIIKFFAWEQRFAEGLTQVREKELSLLKKRFVVTTLGSMVWFITPTIITLLSFGIYTLVEKKPLSTAVAFTALSLFNIMRTPMDQISNMLTNVVQSKVSLDRVQNFLDEEDTAKYVQLSHVVRGPNSPILGFEHASFTWDSLGGEGSNGFQLTDLNVEFQVGKLNVVVGPTGAGKSSLLLALLGEMDLLDGQVFLPHTTTNPHNSSVAYCSQQAWLLNATFRENIIFASPFDAQRYQAVVAACGLQRDLDILEHGDNTDVGEKGIALSGGQKQRISLARALYSPTQTLLLDDCLSAVDSHTALWIYDHCITGPLMRGRTCVLVSHNVALTIGLASNVVVMDKGRVKAQGPPAQLAAEGALGDDELVNVSASNSASWVESAVGLNKIGDESVAMRVREINDKLGKLDKAALGATVDIVDSTVTAVSATKMVQEETSARGRFDLEVYTGYMRSMGGYPFWILVLAVLVGQQLANMVQSWWIREWTMSYNDIAVLMKSYNPTVNFFLPDFGVFSNTTVGTTSKASHSTIYYLSIYSLFGLTYMFVATVRNLVVFFGGLTASRTMFNQLLHSILFAKLRFFDATPVGRIMNRFSKDIESIDQEVSPTALFMVQSLLSAISVVILISIITPGFLIAGLFIMIVYYTIGSLYLETSRELKRLESITKSPIYQHFAETLVGVPTIRAYGHEARFINDNLDKIDTNNRPFFYMWVCNRWLSFRVDFAGALVTFFAGAFVLLSIGKIDSGLAGLSLSYAVTFSESMLWVIRMYANNEMNMNSVERIQEYLSIDQEAPAIIESSRPPVNWPSQGAIEVHDLSLRYAPDLGRVIKNASFKVAQGSKVGIVGRTGAGKSTIITAFFRLLEAETGFIKIDGVDISQIGLRDLRQALAIIPQDPTLFVGTLRTNLDPFEQYSDEQIYEALHRVRLIDTIPTMGETLDDRNQFYLLSSPVSEGGSNLSQGQRQLMCLARSLLKSPKVILLDEATASIDYDTDAQIQLTIRKEFDQTTILTIAHRLRSIIDYDMILVLDAGQVVEYDDPYLLLQKKDGLFHDMCANSGEMRALELMAEKSYNAKNGI